MFVFALGVSCHSPSMSTVPVVTSGSAIATCMCPVGFVPSLFSSLWIWVNGCSSLSCCMRNCKSCVVIDHSSKSRSWFLLFIGPEYKVKLML